MRHEISTSVSVRIIANNQVVTCEEKKQNQHGSMTFDFLHSDLFVIVYLVFFCICMCVFVFVSLCFFLYFCLSNFF